MVYSPTKWLWVQILQRAGVVILVIKKYHKRIVNIALEVYKRRMVEIDCF